MENFTQTKPDKIVASLVVVLLEPLASCIKFHLLKDRLGPEEDEEDQTNWFARRMFMLFKQKTP